MVLILKASRIGVLTPCLALVLCLALPGVVGAVDPDTIGLFRPDSPTGNNTYFLRNTNTLGPPANTIAGFGNTGDLAVVGDWDGDGIVTIGVFRPNTPAGTNTFFLRNTNNLGVGDITIESIGQNGDIPIVGDWDGNGTTTVGLLRPDSPPGSNTLFLWNSNNSPAGPPDITIVGIGATGDRPIAGKWTGSGASSIGLMRSNSPSGLNTFFIWNTLPTTPPYTPDVTIGGIGAVGDEPLAGDWNGNATVSIGLFRPGAPSGTNTFFLWNSIALTPPYVPDVTVAGFGAVGDHPVAGHFGNNPPVVDPATFSVPAQSPNGTNVGTPVTFTDPDAGQNHTYSITAGNTNNAFAIGASTGQITVNNSAALDESITPSFSLTVRVTDDGTPVFFGEATITVNLTKASQTITFTSSAPAAASVGGPTYNVTATATSGLAVTFAIDASASSVCSIAGSTVSFIGVGTCVINANQAGDANYNAAPQVQQSFAVGKSNQTISFTSSPPATPTVGGGTYTVTATATSGLAVTFTIDASASTVCSIAGSVVSFGPNAGTCVINANQAGDATYNAAPQVQQSFGVKKSQTISFTSAPPNPALYQGPTYNVTATATSGLTVTFTIDASASTVCSIAGSTVSFIGTGTCVINANQAGDGQFYPAPQVQQSFGVFPNPAPDAYNALGNVLVDSSNGPGTPFSVTTNDLFPAGTTISTFDATSTNGGTVTMTTSGANMGRFTYNPPVGYTGSDSFTYTLLSNGRARAGTVTFTVTGKVWFINDNPGACTSTCNGRLTNPYVNTSNFQGDNTGAALKPSANDAIFVYGGGGAYSGAMTLLNGQRLIGQGASGTLATLGNVTPQNGQTLPATGGTAPVLGSALTVGNANFIYGLTSSMASGSLISGAPAALTVGTVTLLPSGTANGFNITGGSGVVALTNVTMTGTSSGDVVKINTGTQTWTLTSSPITQTAGRALNVTNKTGGGMTFDSAPVTVSAGVADGAITLSGNSGGETFTFSGKLALTVSGANRGFVASSSGTVNVADNTSTLSATGGAALDFQNTIIGASGLNFQSISATGGTNGIVLNTTGAAGGLTVVGNAGTCTSLASTCTGGTIQNTTGHAVALTSTMSPSFNFMKIMAIALSGIHGTGVTNFTLANSVIDVVNTSHTADDGNVAFNVNGGGSTETNLSGTVSITNNTLNNSYQAGIDILNFAGTISSLTITGNSLTSSTSSTLSFGSAVSVYANKNNGGATFAAITAGSISGNTIVNFPVGAGIEVLVGNTGSGPVGGNIGSLASPLLIQNNTITGQGPGALGIGTNGIAVTVGHQSDGFFTIGQSGQPNTITNVKGNGIACSKFGNDSGSGTNASKCVIAFNVIDANNTANSPGINTGADSATANTNTPLLYLDIHDNTVSNTTGNGILSTIRSVDGTGIFHIENNNVAQPTLVSGTTYGIRVDAGNGTESAGATLCLKISGNTTAGSHNATDTVIAPGIGLRQQHTVVTSTFQIDGLTPATANDAQMEAYVGNAGQNPGSANGTFGATGVASVSAGATYVAATCTIP